MRNKVIDLLDQTIEELDKEGLKKIQNYKDVIFWSFSRKDYQKTNWWPKTKTGILKS